MKATSVLQEFILNEFAYHMRVAHKRGQDGRAITIGDIEHAANIVVSRLEKDVEKLMEEAYEEGHEAGSSQDDPRDMLDPYEE